jgi:hypothetical protein
MNVSIIKIQRLKSSKVKEKTEKDNYGEINSLKVKTN